MKIYRNVIQGTGGAEYFLPDGFATSVLFTVFLICPLTKEAQSKPALLFTFQRVSISRCLLDTTHNAARCTTEATSKQHHSRRQSEPFHSRMEMAEDQLGPFVPQKKLESTGFLIFQTTRF